MSPPSSGKHVPGVKGIALERRPLDVEKGGVFFGTNSNEVYWLKSSWIGGGGSFIYKYFLFLILKSVELAAFLSLKFL